MKIRKAASTISAVYETLAGNKMLYAYILLALLVIASVVLTGCGSPEEPDPDAKPGIWGSFVNVIKDTIVYMRNILESLGMPYSYGFAIILFTLLIRVFTLPLTLQQLRSSKAMQEMQPKLKELQKKYGKDREKMAQAQMELYKEAGVNPLGGCLPMLVQFPIWIGLYRAIYQMANEGILTGGFLWLDDLAFPYPNTGISWVWKPMEAWRPDAIGGPGISWAAWAGYMTLPVIMVLSQYALQLMMAPPQDGESTDPTAAAMQQSMKFMPLMFGFFALQVPSGLTLYWFTSNVVSMVQQYFITGWGGLEKYLPEGMARKTPAPGEDDKKGKKDGKRRDTI